MRGTHIFMLVLGIGLGMLLSSLRAPSLMAPLTQPVSPPVLTQDETPAPIANDSQKYDLLGRAPDQTPTLPKAADSPKNQDELHRFQWEENLIAQMESEWDDLPRYAVAEETAEGWRVHLTAEDRLFAKVGLKSGDMITHEGIRAELANPVRAPLAGRISAILSHIKQ